MHKSIPPSIIMLAAASRLIDLHQSRRQTGVTTPEVPDNADRHLGIALMLLEALRDIEMERGMVYVTVEELHLHLSQHVDEIERDELNFVLATLAKEREIHYVLPNAEHQFDYGRTRKTTNLVVFSDSQEQVKISENGRLFLRIADDEQAWLYSDSDANKLITALEHNKFFDIPIICRKIGQDLAAKGAMLADHIARPTRLEQSEILIADGSGIGTMLESTKAIVRKAMGIAFDEKTVEDFQSWKIREQSALEIGNIQAELETLLRIVETVARKFMEFLDMAQQRQDVMFSELHFLDIANNLAMGRVLVSRKQLESLMGEIVFPLSKLPWFHPSALPGEIDFAEYMNVSQRMETAVFDFSEAPSSEPEKRFRIFIDHHRDKIYALLAKGPVSFSEFISSHEFELLPGESPIDFIGVYITPDAVDDNGSNSSRLVVGFTADDFTCEIDNKRIIASNPILFIEDKKQAGDL